VVNWGDGSGPQTAQVLGSGGQFLAHFESGLRALSQAAQRIFPQLIAIELTRSTRLFKRSHTTKRLLIYHPLQSVG